ncbi:MAG: threonine synthase [Bacteroidota bacterium]
MKFYSLNKQAPEVSFREAVIQGIAPDKGLYFPEEIPRLPDAFFETIDQKDSISIAYEAMKPFVQPDIPDEALKDILRGVLDFDFPLVEIEENVAALELFHGPTMAFKDVGARFMARCLGYFFRDSDASVTVLVATSGDTGGAVANGFLGVKGVNVVILYPDGKVSDIQERQLTTLGQNISALKVDGTFDDCQNMVKRAFLDEDLKRHLQLTSANSINVARWLPQLLYYLFAYKNVRKKSLKPIFSVPSGNFGNICAGMVARRMGMPCDGFIAATNINDTVPEFMRTQEYRPKPSSQTISNAMDVGDPSNFIRIRHLYNDSFDALEKELSSYSFTDDMTRNAIAEIHSNSAYIADPHGAVGYLGLKAHQKTKPDGYGIFLETAHPVKFIDVVENTLGVQLEIPRQIQQVMGKEKHAESIVTYEQLKEYLLRS